MASWKQIAFDPWPRQSSTRRIPRNRPSDPSWSDIGVWLNGQHTDHGWLPQHVLAEAGRRLGVAPTSVGTGYRRYLRLLEAQQPWQLGDVEASVMSAAHDLPDAYRRLAAAGPVPPFPVVERAVWRATHRHGLSRLRQAERRRRQVAAESGVCVTCLPSLAINA